VVTANAIGYFSFFSFFGEKKKKKRINKPPCKGCKAVYVLDTQNKNQQQGKSLFDLVTRK